MASVRVRGLACGLWLEGRVCGMLIVMLAEDLVIRVRLGSRLEFRVGCMVI